MDVDRKYQVTRVLIAAGGTGGHIFPALAVALDMRRRNPQVRIVWAGTPRSREAQLCQQHGFEFYQSHASGYHRRVSIQFVFSIARFFREFLKARAIVKKERPEVIVGFGGYVCAPILAAASISRIPIFLHEQNTRVGLVNRLFAVRARMIFLGFPLVGGWKWPVKVKITGTPVRHVSHDYRTFAYPDGFRRECKSILICGGSQGARSMNQCLFDTVRQLAAADQQIIWQTGRPGYQEVLSEVGKCPSVFVMDTIEDMYPYYAAAKLVVGRAGASTLSEAAYFGLPFIAVPLPWSADNHQWTNAGLIEAQGWGIRVAQNDAAGTTITGLLEELCRDGWRLEMMSRRALDNSPPDAAAEIVDAITEELAE